MSATPTPPQPSVTVGQLAKALEATPGPREDVEKASQAGAYAVRDMFLSNGVVENPVSNDEWISLYTDHVWSHAGIAAIARNIAGLKPQLWKVPAAGGDPELVDDHPCINLLRRPNPSMTGLELMETMSIHLETVGRAFWEVVYGQKDTKVGGRVVKSEGGPVELWPIRPTYMSPEPAKDGHGVQRWVFQSKKGAKREFFDPDQIVPFKYVNPLNEWYGLGSLMPAIDDIRQDRQAAKWNIDFFAHGITPEGILKTEKVITPNEMKSLGEQIKQFLAGKGRQVLILGKGLEWQQVSVNPKDIEFVQGRNRNREAVLAALGVPPVMVGLLEHAKYDNYALQLEAFCKHTLLHKILRIESCLECFYLPLWPDMAAEAEPGYDGDRHEIRFDRGGLLLEQEDKTTNRAVTLFTNGLATVNEALKDMGREPVEDEEIGNKRFIASTFVPMDQAGGDQGMEAANDGLTQAVRGLQQNVGNRIKAVEKRLDDVAAAVESAVK